MSSNSNWDANKRAGAGQIASDANSAADRRGAIVVLGGSIECSGIISPNRGIYKGAPFAAHLMVVRDCERVVPSPRNERRWNIFMDKTSALPIIHDAEAHSRRLMR